MKEIVQKDDPILRKAAKHVPISEIGSEKINKVIHDMSAAMARQKDGVAIAAPQIGVNMRIFVISDELLRTADRSYKGDGSNLVFINPEIVRSSREKRDVEEGCLSVRWLYGKVKRSSRVTLRAYDEKGKKIERGASGLMAQIFQHEMDHLEGVLFIDKAKEIWEMSPEEIKELQGTVG
jgi:peptide deformylase